MESDRSFAKSLLRYLVEKDDWGERGGKLYVLTNGFRQRGHFGVKDGRGDLNLSRHDSILGEIALKKSTVCRPP